MFCVFMRRAFLCGWIVIEAYPSSNALHQILRMVCSILAGSKFIENQAMLSLFVLLKSSAIEAYLLI